MSAIKDYLKIALSGLTILLFIPFLYLAGDKNKTPRQRLSNIILKILGVKPKIIGAQNPNTTMFIINHQSVLDIVVIEAISSTNFCWIAKTELFNLPLFGHLFKSCKMIGVDRDSKQGLIKLIKDSKNAIENNRPLVIFPEGTRSKDDRLLEFKPGAKIIAEILALKIQPVGIVDSAKLVDTKHSVTSAGGELKVIFMEPLDISKKGWLEEAREAMQKRLDEERAK